MQNGADFVVNLAAGLDAQPYRIQLPTTLQWLEVDLPDIVYIVYYEEDVLENEKPRCRLERIPLDLSDAGARHSLLGELNSRAMKIVVLTDALPAELLPPPDELPIVTLIRAPRKVGGGCFI